MKKMKRLGAIMLAMLMVMQCVACSGKKEPTNDNPSITPTKGVSDKEQNNQEGEKKSSLYFEDTLSFTWMLAESDIPLKDDILTLNWLRENMNVDIHIMAVPDSDYETKLSTMTATNSLPDVVDVDSNVIESVAGSGMLLNLSDYEKSMPDYIALIEGEDRANNTATYKYNGDIYGFQILEDYRVGIAPLPVIRTDLLEKYNIKTPTSWEELYDAMLIIKENDPNNYVFSTRNGITYLLGNIAYSMGAGGYGATQNGFPVYYEPDQDRYIYGPAKDEFKNAVQYLANAYKDGLLHPDYNIMDRTMVTSYLTSGTLAVVIDNTTFTNSYNNAIQELYPEAYFDMLDPLTYGGNTKARQVTFSKDWDQFTVINSKVERAEDLVKFFNWLYTEEGALLTNYGVEGETYEMVEGTPKLLDSVSAIGDYATLRANYGLGTWYIARFVNENTYMDMFKYQEKMTGIAPVNMTQADRIQKLKEEGILVHTQSFPSFTNEETERLTTLETNLNTVFDQEINKFITGQRSMEEWGSFVEELKGMGVAEVEEIYNTAYSRLK